MKKLTNLAMGVVLGATLIGLWSLTKNETVTYKLSNVEYANYSTLDYKIEVIEAYNEYYKQVETMLDSISIHYNWADEAPSSYYDARDRLEYLWSLEDDDDPIINK